MKLSSASAKARARRVGRDEVGTSAVEFAIVGPVFILMLMAIIAVGWAVYNVMTVRWAVEQAGRTLAVNPTMTQSALQTLVRTKAGYSDIDITLTVDPKVGDEKLAHVAATYQFTISFPLLPDYTINYSTSITVPLWG